jgi:hypothetical protein
MHRAGYRPLLFIPIFVRTMRKAEAQASANARRALEERRDRPAA